MHPFLESHPQHELALRQMDGGGGTVVTFEVEGGKAAAFALMNALTLVDISNNLGDAKSLTTHPATTTHRRLEPEARAAVGITDGTIRVSVGLEDVRDLVADLDAPAACPIPALIPGYTDARYFARLGIQTYGFLPMRLPKDITVDLIHAPDERVPAEAIRFGADCLVDAIRRFRRLDSGSSVMQ